jgi:hypothetical protein
MVPARGPVRSSRVDSAPRGRLRGSAWRGRSAICARLGGSRRRRRCRPRPRARDGPAGRAGRWCTRTPLLPRLRVVGIRRTPRLRYPADGHPTAPRAAAIGGSCVSYPPRCANDLVGGRRSRQTRGAAPLAVSADHVGRHVLRPCGPDRARDADPRSCDRPTDAETRGVAVWRAALAGDPGPTSTAFVDRFRANRHDRPRPSRRLATSARSGGTSARPAMPSTRGTSASRSAAGSSSCSARTPPVRPPAQPITVLVPAVRGHLDRMPGRPAAAAGTGRGADEPMSLPAVEAVGFDVNETCSPSTGCGRRSPTPASIHSRCRCGSAGCCATGSR